MTKLERSKKIAGIVEYIYGEIEVFYMEALNNKGTTSYDETTYSITIIVQDLFERGSLKEKLKKAFSRCTDQELARCGRLITTGNLKKRRLTARIVIPVMEELLGKPLFKYFKERCMDF